LEVPPPFGKVKSAHGPTNRLIFISLSFNLHPDYGARAQLKARAVGKIQWGDRVALCLT
jgi:hypothetical protein